ncbi:cysteine hydrolase family protein [Actinomadura sp. SCN-SB]|uniref:cysteine hydrolase family protein n=1 Tax=Actinomadura sp. SCN-SB TaxID=3373092 RepID=UPI0037524B1E
MTDIAGRQGGGGLGVLVVDMVRALADATVPGHEPDGPPAAERCRLLLDAARAAGLPIWFTRGGKRWHTSTASPLSTVERGGWLRRNGWKQDPPEAAQLAMEIAPRLAPRPGEVVLTKSKPSAFFGTPLISQLLSARVSELIVVGMMTSGCVRATVTDAFSYDLDVTVPVDCVADRDAAAHEANLRDIGRKYATLLDAGAFTELIGRLEGGAVVGR